MKIFLKKETMWLKGSENLYEELGTWRDFEVQKKEFGVKRIDSWVQWCGSGKGACLQARWPEFRLQNPYGRRREQIPAKLSSDFLPHVSCGTNAPTYRQSHSNNNELKSITIGYQRLQYTSHLTVSALSCSFTYWWCHIYLSSSLSLKLTDPICNSGQQSYNSIKLKLKSMQT